MAATYEPIATTTLSSAASSITFSSIPSTYTDLRIVLVTTTSVTTNIRMRYNSDTATNYSYTEMGGDGTAAYSGRASNATFIDVSNASTNTDTTIPTAYWIDIFSYAGSTYKTSLGSDAMDKNGTGGSDRYVGLWRSTSAINTVGFVLGSGNFNTGTTATLYGIKAA